MKSIISTRMIFILLTTVICGGCKQVNIQDNDFITVDVTASYPHKKLILQDFMDVEYIPLETTDEFVCEGFLEAVGKDIIVVRSKDSGDIFIFDRKGKAVRKINRKGQGAEEYTQILGITLDEDNSELFVNNIYGKKVIVYDLEGNFKRSFPQKEDFMYGYIFNFDQDNLICYDVFNENNSIVFHTGQPLMLISKQDGSITKEIKLPFKEKKTTAMRIKDEASGVTYVSMPSAHYPIIPYQGNYLLVEPSSDTIYSYSPAHVMTPLIARTPSVQSMDPEVFLFLSIFTDRYYFMRTVKKEYDFETRKGFHEVDLMYDKQKKAIFKYTIYNDDYLNEGEVYMTLKPINEEIATWLPLTADRLVEAYEKGKLKGRLKEIAAKLDDESNPVIMLIKHKK